MHALVEEQYLQVTACITSVFFTVAIFNVSLPLSVVEGNTGIANVYILVELQISSVPLARDVIVTLSTEDGTATGKLLLWGRGDMMNINDTQVIRSIGQK